MHSAITAIDAELAAAAVMMTMNKPLSHQVQYLIFIYANMLCAYISHKSSSSSSNSSSKRIPCGHILYAKITSLLHPLHIRPDLY